MTKIIAIEGIDGTGKTVQLKNLEERLRAQGLSVRVLSFPVYDSFFGGEVGKYLSAKEGVSAAEVDPKSMALWFAMDRFDAFRHFSYDGSDVLLLNRYVLSNAVYQSIRCKDPFAMLDFVLDLEHRHLGLPVPDLYLILDMDMESASENVRKKGFREYVGGETKDVYESADGIQSGARRAYRAFADRLPNARLINCMGREGLLPIEEIGKRIDEAVSSVLDM